MADSPLAEDLELLQMINSGYMTEERRVIGKKVKNVTVVEW